MVHDRAIHHTRGACIERFERSMDRGAISLGCAIKFEQPEQVREVAFLKASVSKLIGSESVPRVPKERFLR